MLRIEVIATGNELLDGTIVDRHTCDLAKNLRPLGFKIEHAQICRDEPQSLKRAITEAITRADVIVITGGLGPTEDDLTLKVVSEAFGSQLVFHSAAKANVMSRLKNLKRKILNAGDRKQFLVPKGSKILKNTEGTAPALEWKVGDRTLFFVPGVPREFSLVLKKHLIPWFEKQKSTDGHHLFVLKVFGWPESELNELVKKMGPPPGVIVGFRTHLPENHIKIQVRAASRPEARKTAQPLIKKLRLKLGKDLFSEGDETFEEVVVSELIQGKKQMAVAESCTGGLVCSLLTQVSGASKTLERGFVTYSNKAKEELLGVRSETLKRYGAVSKQTALEMAKGAREKAHVDLAIAITGIAGPTGGSKDKPVGLVWIAGVSKHKTISQKYHFRFDRKLIQRFSAYSALQLVRKLI